MSKWKDFQYSVKNPPPERLAAIEYRSHFLQIIGVSVVSVILIFKGLWYIIFAFIFSIGASYSQGMSAYQKYKILMQLKPKEKLEDYELDISPTRRRSKIVKSVFGEKTPFAVSFLIILAPILLVDPTISRWKLFLAYPIIILLGYTAVYFGILFWIAYPIYKKRLEGGKNEFNKNSNSRRYRRS